MLYFWKKLEKSPKRWELGTKPPLASGSWELFPQTPKLLHPLKFSVTFEHCSSQGR